ncbi:MAG: pectin acetylesterase-family hydrolase [Gemmatimonadaceae bacterium]
MSRAVLMLSAVLLACASRPAVVQSGGPAPVVAPAPAPAAAKPRAVWADTARRLDALSRGWNRIPGREGTGCAEDSTFVFKVRPGLPDKVLVYLNGGGLCWRGGECDAKSRPTYTTNADSANDVSVRSGILDVNNEANPFREYTMIFVSYCTGDAHLGARTTEYQSANGKRTFSIRHEGAENVESVLEWLYSNVRAPRTVFVAGTDAGAIASPVVAAKVARHYPRARVVQLGDGAGALRGKSAATPMAVWGVPEYLRRDNGFRAIPDDELTFERLYIAAGRAASRVHYAQVNSADDATQLAQLAQLGVKGQATSKLLAANMEQIRSSVPWFRSYTLPGRAHSILRSPAMYTAKVRGMAFSEWLASLAEGESVTDVK